MSSDKEHITYNIGESHKHNVEWKKSDIKEYILHDFIY